MKSPNLPFKKIGKGKMVLLQLTLMLALGFVVLSFRIDDELLKLLSIFFLGFIGLKYQAAASNTEVGDPKLTGRPTLPPIKRK